MLAIPPPVQRPPSLIKRVLDAVLRPPAARPYSEMGVAGTAVWSGYVQTRERSPRWLGTQRYVTISDMAVNTSIIAAGVHYFLNLLAHPKWTFAPADESDEAKAAAEFVEEVLLHGMDLPWTRVVRRAGTYRFYGFGIQEWTARRRPDGRVGLRSIEPRPQHTIEQWVVADDGAVDGVWQRAPKTGELLGLPRSKFLYLVDDALTDSPEGVGLFRHLAEPWERLKAYYDLEARAFERDLRGIPVGRVPYSALSEAVKNGEMTQAQVDLLTKAMEDFVQLQVRQSNTSITLDSLPYYSQAADGNKVAGVPQWGLELLQGAATGVGELGVAITRTQMEMARILTVEHLMMGESAGNRALSEDKSRNLYLVANSVLGDIAAGVDADVVAAVCLLNGIPDELRPKCEVEDVAFKDAETVAATLQKMALAGATLAPDDPVIEDVRSLMGVSAPSPVSPEMAGLPGEGTPPAGPPGETATGSEPAAKATPLGKYFDPDSAAGTMRVLLKFDPSQPRDPAGTSTGGRWSGSGAAGALLGAGVSSEGAAAALLAEAAGSTTLESFEAGLSPEDRAMVASARAAVAAGTPTRAQYMQADGTYTPAREALHEKILGDMFTPAAVAAAMPAPGTRPELVMTGGRPAAGKTSALRSGGIDAGPPKYIYLSADTIQEHLPDYSGERAGLYNPEAQDIADKAETMARRLGVNVVFDATMKTNTSALARVDRFHQSGYDVSAYFVHTSPEVSARRSVARFVETGRFVPPEVSLNSRTNEATFDELTPKLKKWALFDNNGAAPRLVARSW